MPRGIIIFGSAGADKTTLGKMVAQQLNYPYYDIDNYIWRKDTDNGTGSQRTTNGKRIQTKQRPRGGITLRSIKI